MKPAKSKYFLSGPLRKSLQTRSRELSLDGQEFMVELVMYTEKMMKPLSAGRTKIGQEGKSSLALLHGLALNICT